MDEAVAKGLDEVVDEAVDGRSWTTGRDQGCHKGLAAGKLCDPGAGEIKTEPSSSLSALAFDDSVQAGTWRTRRCCDDARAKGEEAA